MKFFHLGRQGVIGSQKLLSAYNVALRKILFFLLIWLIQFDICSPLKSICCHFALFQIGHYLTNFFGNNNNNTPCLRYIILFFAKAPIVIAQNSLLLGKHNTILAVLSLLLSSRRIAHSALCNNAFWHSRFRSRAQHLYGYISKAPRPKGLFIVQYARPFEID